MKKRTARMIHRFKAARHKSASRGFTLLEVMVAIMVVSMIMTLIWQAFAQTVESKNYVEAGNEMYHQLRWALNKMTYDLSSAYVLSGKNSKSQFVGVSKESGDGIPQDEMSFTSFSHIRYSSTEKSSDQCEISYFVVQNPLDMTFTLFRREDYTVDDNLDTGGEINELVEGIVAFNLRYYDGEEWVDDWDSRNFADLAEDFVEINVEQSEEMVETIPAAVEIAISMTDDQGQEIFMTTKVKLVLSTITILPAEEGENGDDDDGKSSGASGSDSGSSSNSPQGGYIGAG